MRSKHTRLRRTVIAGITALLPLAAMAQSSSEDMIKYRQAVMRAQGGHFGAIGAIVAGKVPFGDRLAGHARSLHELSMEVAHIFPEGSGEGKTKALPEIWSDRDGFAAVAADMEKASAALVAAAEAGDMAAVGDRVNAVLDQCKACHKKYRAED